MNGMFDEGMMNYLDDVELAPIDEIETLGIKPWWNNPWHTFCYIRSKILITSSEEQRFLQKMHQIQDSWSATEYEKLLSILLELESVVSCDYLLGINSPKERKLRELVAHILE